MASIVGSVDSRTLDGDIRRADSLLSLEECIRGCSSYVPNLAVDEAALGMYSIDDTLPACALTLGEDSWDAWVS